MRFRWRYILVAGIVADLADDTASKTPARLVIKGTCFSEVVNPVNGDLLPGRLRRV
jgi:hypothetical protein